ncbi:MAG: tRNA (adenosine(37)-N6)-threonylcarbamoyltransferase complex ATPase subunit type 1 TsaE, partial [Spirochaetales bacterium]
PTFTLISEYAGKMPLYHMDVYRLDTAEDFIDLGAEELLYGDGISVIEWSEKILSELPKNSIFIKLETLPGDNSEKRKICIENWKYGTLNL